MLSPGERASWAAAVLAIVAVLCSAAPAVATFPGQNGQLLYGSPGFGEVPIGRCHLATQLSLVAPDATANRRLTNDAGLYFGVTRWSPDSTRFSVVVKLLDQQCLERVYVVDAGTGTYQEVPCGTNCRGGGWSADGTRLLVIPDVFGTVINSIHSVNLDGSDLRLLVAAKPGTSIADPTMSADGRLIAYTLTSGTTASRHIVSVMIADFDGSNPRRIGTGSVPEFSPDSTRILWTRDNGERLPLTAVVSDLDGGQVVPVAPAAGLPTIGLSWSPDGTQVIVASRGPFEFGNTMLAVRAPQGTQAQPPGVTSARCLRGYRVLLRGNIEGASWGSREPVTGAAADPASIPCPNAPPPVPVSTPPSQSGLRSSITARRGELRVRVSVAEGALGRIAVTATQRGRALRRRGLAGRGTVRTYRFAVRHRGRATVSVSFAGRDGWASKRLRTRRVRVRP